MNIIKLCDFFADKVLSGFLKSAKAYFIASEQSIKQWFISNQNILEELVNLNWHPLFKEDIIQAKKDDRFYIISKDKKIGYNASKLFLLQGYSEIPNCFLYIVKEQKVKSDSYILKDNEWLIDYLKIYMRDFSFDDFYKKVNEFAENNEDKILEAAKMIRKKPNLLGFGASGAAFDIGDNKVIKLFDDEFIYDKSKQAMNRLFTNPDIARTEAVIYDVGHIGNFVGRPVYYYIIEKTKPLSTNEFGSEGSKMKVPEYKLDTMISYLVGKVNDLILDDQTIDRIKKRQISLSDKELDVVLDKISLRIIRNGFAEEVTETTKQLGEKENLRKDWLKLFIKEIILKYLTGRGDLNSSNVGITPYGELRFFDPTHKIFENKLND